MSKYHYTSRDCLWLMLPFVGLFLAVIGGIDDGDILS